MKRRKGYRYKISQETDRIFTATSLVKSGLYKTVEEACKACNCPGKEEDVIWRLKTIYGYDIPNK